MKEITVPICTACGQPIVNETAIVLDGALCTYRYDKKELKTILGATPNRYVKLRDGECVVPNKDNLDQTAYHLPCLINKLNSEFGIPIPRPPINNLRSMRSDIDQPEIHP